MLLEWIGRLLKEWGPARIFLSHTFLLGFGTALSALLVWWRLPALWDKLPRDHGKALVKDGALSAGKPTGAGLLLLLLVIPSLVLALPLPPKPRFDPVWGTIPCLFAAMATGYFDDRSARPWGRLRKGLLDLAVSFGTAAVLCHFEPTTIWLPFWKHPFLLPAWGYILMAVPVLWFTMNATNCSDGVDGLAGTLTLISLFALSAVLYGVVGHSEFSRYLLVPHNPDGARWAILCCIVGGGIGGYLWWNANPSRVLMGDAGSRALGLLVGVAALAAGNPFLVLVMAPVALANGGTGLLKLVLLKTLSRMGVDTGSQEDSSHSPWLVRKLRSFRFPIHDHCRTNLGWSGAQVLLRFILIQLALTPVLFLLLLKVR